MRKPCDRFLRVFVTPTLVPSYTSGYGLSSADTSHVIRVVLRGRGLFRGPVGPGGPGRDHARACRSCPPGSRSYLTAEPGRHVLQTRMGAKASIETLPYGAPLDINGVRVSLHPAGHILGSSQVRVEHRGEVWVVSGDYKVARTGCAIRSSRSAATHSSPNRRLACHLPLETRARDPR